jgi:hypothetical protein
MVEPEPTLVVQAEENITRHCRDSGHMRAGLMKGHYKAFMPPPNRRLSVVRSSGLDGDQIEAIGRMHVHKDVQGHASVGVGVAQERGLSIEPEPHPHPRHANVVGWSDADEANRLAARALAEASNLTLY